MVGDRPWAPPCAPDGGGDGGSGHGGSGHGGSGHGVITGRQFNMNPMPPQADILGNPLVVGDLPTHKMPKEKFADRFQRFMAGMHLGAQSAETQMRWKIQDMTATILASVSPAVTLSAEQRAQIKRKGRNAQVIIIRHPYHIRHILDFVPKVPDSLGTDRRFLELLLSRCLKKYGEQMSLMKGSAFSFEAECKEYLLSGFRLERGLKQISAPDEKFNAMQIIYNNYFHGKNYYYYALLRRERMNPENKLFMMFSRACYFLARVDWSGELQEKPNPRMLPDRTTLYFYLQRDKAVLQHYQTDQAFQRQVKSVINAFPE